MAGAILVFSIFFLCLGSLGGFLFRTFLSKRGLTRLEKEISSKREEVEKKAKEILEEARSKAKKEIEKIFEKEKLLLEKEKILTMKEEKLTREREGLEKKLREVEVLKKKVENLKEREISELENISRMKKEEAKEKLLEMVENETKEVIGERLRRLETEGEKKFERRAREILATVVQRFTLPQVHELTTSIFTLPSDEWKGKIIGKEGRNIRIFEKLTGVELIIDETPEIVVISSFNPIRREVAKMALEKLIKEGKIQPQKIEEKIKEAESEIDKKILDLGESALNQLEIYGIPDGLKRLLGSLYFRQSYGQNVLIHSIEVAFLAEGLAFEIGANPKIAKVAGIFHDIGKTIDMEVKGSHVQIGMRVLEKFGIEKEVIEAMRCHHEEFPPESIEAILVQVADQISGARPGARRDTVENYLKRIEDLEKLALSFPSVEKAWAFHGGRELWVFLQPEKTDDYMTRKLAKEIAKKIENELKFPGEIKVVVIREAKVVEYAK